ncbi:MAG TPA: hypothetical protein VIX86_14305 [Streptosporangiaceae bacterium]
MRIVRRWLRPGMGHWPGVLVAVPVTAAALICAGCAGSASPVAASGTAKVSAVPTLGRPAGLFAHGAGFGEVRPARIFNGGDPTGLLVHVVWTSWGGSRAVGTGTSDYVGPNQSVATGRQQQATVVAFNLGTCHGKLMYRAVEWYFPQHGQSFSASHYQDICNGAYVPAG